MSDRDARIDAAIAEWLEAEEAAPASPPDADAWLARHPDLAGDLRAFLADRRRLDPLRSAVGAAQPPPAPAEPAPGRFGDFDVHDEIGRGGMGTVWRAHQRSLGRTVALKMILADRLATDAAVRRFRAEAEAAAHLDHPGIVPLYEVGEHQGRHFYTMRYLDGGSLDRHLQRYIGDARRAAALVADVARAVHYAHRRGLLHRDLKPANILLDEAGRPHVTDFGLAKQFDAPNPPGPAPTDGDPTLTPADAVVGTPSYMAPEQASGVRLTAAADVYSLGAILFELLTGEPPFRAATAHDTLRLVRDAPPPSARARSPQVDGDLDAIATKCLEKDPAQRYPTAEALAEDLERWLAGSSIRARARRRGAAWRWSAVLGGAAAVWLAAAAHEHRALPAPRWRLLAIFVATILGLVTRPLPGGALVLLALVAAVATGALDHARAFAGFLDPIIWLIVAAYLLARAFLKTGLARRIALHFIRRLGRSTLGLAYALVAADTVLAAVIPSVAARVGGVMLPITRSLAEQHRSFPDHTARRLGRFLVLALYQGGVVACALFLTGQASNPLAARQAAALTHDAVTLDYARWLLYAAPPALVSLALTPWLVHRWEPPAVTATPAAADFARAELDRLGPPARDERLLLGVLLALVAAWLAVGVAHAALLALAAVGALLVAGVLTWEEVVAERTAWDVFIWYGGLLQLGTELHAAGLTTEFARAITAPLGGWGWQSLFIVTALVYFYSHYAFASITTHVASLYPAFLAVLLAAGAPPTLAAACLAFFANLSAGLTHYGTTPGPILFSVGYVPQRTWWRVGARLSLVHLAVWFAVGAAWWKILKIW